jgi:hypothetical protein
MEIDSYRKDGHLITISCDEFAESPREWDNLGTILYTSSRYILGDQRVPTEEIEEICNDDNFFYLPVYAYIHGGITLSTKPFSCSWDSGQCGIIYCSKQELKNGNISIESAKKIFEDEIKTYAKFIAGETYCYSIKKIIKCDSCGHERFETVESCGGFYEMEILKEEINSWFEAVKNGTH